MTVYRHFLIIAGLILGMLLFSMLFSHALADSFQQSDQEPQPFPTRTPLSDLLDPALLVTNTPFPTLTPYPAGQQPTLIFPATATATPRPPSSTSMSGQVALTSCHLEPKWTYLINVRRGPSDNWGILRQFAHNNETKEFWVFGRNEAANWYHVVMPAPYAGQVGWVSQDGINLFGACDDLPITDAQPEISPEDVPPYPDPVPLPNFAADITLGEFDRAFLVKPGLLYVRRDVPGEEQKDRIQAHALVMDLTDPRLQVSAALGARAGIGGVPLSEIAIEHEAFAAINGDYYAGNYFPQGMTVVNGEVITAPKRRATFGMGYNGLPFIGYFTYEWSWPAYVVASNGAVIPLQLMNVPCENGWLCIYSHHRANRLPVSYRGLRVLLNEQYEVLEIVDNEGLTIPDGYFALRGEGGPADWLRENVQIGDTLGVHLPTDPPWQDFHTVVGGGPRLLIEGEIWLDCYPQAGDFCEEFDFRFRDSHYGLKSLPRTAIGYNAAGTVLVGIVVEGYEIEDSGGMTRRELADFFLDLSAVNAMEFDGGGSSSMYMGWGTVNDHGYEGERRVPNAILFYWNEE